MVEEYCVDIFTDGKHHKCVHTFCDYESAISYIAQNPLSSVTEEYRIGIPSYDDEGLVCVEYLYPPEFAEDVVKVRKGEILNIERNKHKKEDN